MDDDEAFNTVQETDGSGTKHAECDGSEGFRHVKGDGSWWDRDAQGIETKRVCDKCIKEKRKSYRPEVFTGYSQADVDEPIEPDGGFDLGDDWDFGCP